MHRASGTLRAVPWPLILTLCWLVPLAARCGAAEEEHLTADQLQALTPHVLKLHLLRPELDGEHLKRLLKRFLDELDPARTLYTQPEADAQMKLTDAALNALAADVKAGKLDFFTGWVKDFKTSLLPRDADFTAKLADRLADLKAKVPKEEWDKIKPDEFPATLEEHQRRIVMLANREFHLYREYLSEEDALKFVLQNLQRVREKWAPLDPLRQTPDMVMKALLLSLDPHSEYMDAEDVEQFESSMVRGFSGIGVQIRGCPLGAQVQEVIEGTPASKSGMFGVADQIIQVDETPVAGLALSQIVKRIKGPKGSQVKLVLKKAKPDAEGKALATVVLTRDNIDLTELRVKSKKYPTPAGLVGVITVSNFYSGVAGDVTARIRELGKDEPLAGLVLDLRGNSGGLLEEAVKMAGLFVGEGPIVAERDYLDHVSWLYDPDETQVFAGPLVVLINQFSASASEIVAGALRDYGRGILVGPSQTHGKGTVQKVIDLGLVRMPGKIKITFQQYFLARGDSVQDRGVLPDIQIPGPKLLEDFLERKQDGAIPWAAIPGRLDDEQPDYKRYSAWKASVLPTLKEHSAQRVAANKDFEVYKKAELAGDDLDDPGALSPNERPKLGKKADEKDPQMDEAARIVQDALPLWSKDSAAK